jgi:hypothetical protein
LIIAENFGRVLTAENKKRVRIRNQGSEKGPPSIDFESNVNCFLGEIQTAAWFEE